MTNCVKWYLNLIQAADSPYMDPHAGSVDFPDYRPGVITKRSSGVIGFVKLAKGESVYGICELGNYLG